MEGASGRFDALVDAARAGDERAVAEIYRSHHPRLLRVLRGEVGDAADDVASQTWLELMGALGRFEGDERGFRSLLFTIARRRVADHRRSQRRRPVTPTAPEDLHVVADRLGRAGVEADALSRIDGDAAVRRIVAALKPEQAEIVLLRVVADLAVDEVARIVGTSPGNVRVQQHRAMKRLAEVLAAADTPTDAESGPASVAGPAPAPGSDGAVPAARPDRQVGGHRA